MNHSFYDLTWYFFIYSFLGWCLEIIYAAVKKHHFFNRGVLNGPICPVYGLGMVFSLVFFDSLRDGFWFLSIGCGVIATVLEFFTGWFMEKLFQKRWWDYSDYKYNLGGYVCLPFSALWGVLAALTLKLGQPFTDSLIKFLPSLPGKLLLWAALAILAVDAASVLGIAFQAKRLHKQIDEMADVMQHISNRLGRAIFTKIQSRMTKAQPALDSNTLKAKESEMVPDESAHVFAYGCSFYKLVWLFFIGAFLGDITETVFCCFTTGTLMSRSSVVYGPFSIVWGLGVVVLTMMLHRYRDREDRYIFVFGTVVGGAYEYVCSVFTELAFGTVFWDYSKIPFNLGGRINLLYCFFWGLAAVVWIKLFYPKLSRLVERIPMRAGKVLTWFILVFMAFDMLLSAMALARFTERHGKNAPENEIDLFLDTYFPDEYMEWVYPGAIIRE